MLNVILATIHLLALGIGMAAVRARANALRGALDAASIKRAFAADTAWGIAAGLWIATGLWRLLAGMEKDTAYYMQNRWFFAKMGMLALILILEIRPMVTLIKWRRLAAKNELDFSAIQPTAGKIAAVSQIQGILVVLMVLAAVSMARGYGAY